MTDAERVLWLRLRGRGIAGHKFRRQHPIAGCVLDFYCPSARLAIEIDGGQHAVASCEDERRTRRLEAHGVRVLRFWNHEVLTETEAILQCILDALRPSPRPSPRKAGRGSPSTSARRAKALAPGTGEKVG